MIGSYRAEVSKRIDIFATALFNGMTVESLNHLDLSYTPPLSSPWDPVQHDCPSLDLRTQTRQGLRAIIFFLNSLVFFG